MDKQALINRLQDVMQPFSVPFALLHGSVAAGRATTVSDVDVAVYVEEQERFLRLVVALNEDVPVPTPVGTSSGDGRSRRVDVMNVMHQPAWVVYRVLASGEIIHLAEEALYHEVKFRAMREYLDFKPVHDRILRDMERRLAHAQFGRAVE